MPKLSERRGMSGRFAADGKAVCIATKGTAAQANEEAESRGSAPSAQASAQEMAAALREDAMEGDDAGLSEEDQAAIRHDLAVAAGLDVEVSADAAVEPEPVMTQPEAPPPSDGEEEEESSEEAEEEDRPCGSRRARSASSAQPTQSMSRVAKQPRATSSAAGPRGSAPCPRPKRSASRTISAAAPARKRGGKGKKKK